MWCRRPAFCLFGRNKHAFRFLSPRSRFRTIHATTPFDGYVGYCEAGLARRGDLDGARHFACSARRSSLSVFCPREADFELSMQQRPLTVTLGIVRPAWRGAGISMAPLRFALVTSAFTVAVAFGMALDLV